ncbi:MAG: 2-oxoacid:acceptor oxidoreductase subunit alpha [Candidatus Marinimicrobia bacterium]|nr:2-oxoacid:acceptor oxidoreductase subunit alpha [Candidatus Neomarinimicrobiota bacterium]MCF7829749.1 2-oxoacid:acceptor oxidoreductase subunit alpha [Candidatus Neomarinimicrobiota bacterium]MCF7881699.1 2-oxoacid:acceptor oxidoreductase subunit alpha [Candidatus Neomarinimicrobiota bacterium]
MTNTQRLDLNWMIGGAQGSGVNSTAQLYAKLMTRLGYHVFSNIEYHSNIKGKHSNFRVRTANYPIRSHREHVDVLVALDEESLFGDFYQRYPTHRGHAGKVKSGGAIIYDSNEVPDAQDRIDDQEIRLLGIPFREILNESLEEVGKGGEGKKYSIMGNTVAFGASMALLDIPEKQMETAVREAFAGKKSLAEMNEVVARYTYNYVQDNFGDKIEPHFPSPGLENQILIKGSQAVGIAKFKAGCGFQSYYPISPATDESVYLEQHQQDFPMQIIQTEDEVSAINMAVSATHGGVRSSTSTSGPGYALMAEGMGFSAITEAPGPVVCLYQRGGPSTGIPTRQEQGDLRMALHSGQGDYPAIVLAPGDAEEYFYDTHKIFNLCDRYQVPAVLLLDKHIGRSSVSIQPFDTSDLEVDRGPRFNTGEHEYQRYQFDGSPVSPRSIPGEEGGIFWTSSDEHQQDGHISEGIGNRMSMMHKRMSKLKLLLEEYPEDSQVKVFGNRDSDVAVISWGSNKGVLQDLLGSPASENQPDFRFIHLRLINPFPEQALQKALDGAETIIVLEQNWGAHLAGLLQEKLAKPVDVRILKFDGRPFSYDEASIGITDAIENPRERIVLTRGAIRDEETWGYEEVQNLLDERERRPRQRTPSVPLPPNYNR